VTYTLSDDMKIINLGWPWWSVLQQEIYRLRCAFSSDSWAFWLL